jgi:hypothetical protein
MTTTDTRIAPPERLRGQGLDPNQHESGERAIVALLTDKKQGELTDLVMTYRHVRNEDPDSEEPGPGAYEVWSHRGMIRFERFIADEGGFGYRVIEQIGENPIANQDPTALATFAEEMEAAEKSGFSGTEPAKAFVAPEHLSHPLAFDRISQLFDSPNAPDIAISPKSYAFGQQAGQHGSIDVIQSRAPLVMSGPGVKGGTSDAICAHVDVAPTIAKLLDMPLIDGKDSTGRTSSERGVEPDVYLKRQDGKPIDEILDLGKNGEPRSRPERVYLFLMDGLSNTELKLRLEQDRESIPNIARIIERGSMNTYGVIANFPTITWPSHNAIGSGAWCGHHDVVNPTYHLREKRETVSPQGMIFNTGRFLGDEVETLYEALHRVHGAWNADTKKGVVTASINEPCMRGALHSSLERRLMVDSEELRQVTRQHKGDTSPRWKAEGKEGHYRESGADMQGLAQSLLLYGSDDQPPPIFTFHEITLTDGVGHDYGAHSEAERDAIIESDKRIGKILSLLDERGMFESTTFVLTADHGMANIDAALAADQVQAVPDAGIKSVAEMPLVYLIDMDVEVVAQRDGRTATVTVLENDENERGERPAVEGAKVEVVGHKGEVLRTTSTDAFGVAGVSFPSDENPEHMVITVEHEGFNHRHVRLDGSSVFEVNARKRLYGDGA